MPKIFLSYRRDDSAGYAGRVAERLFQAFGHASVFRDIDDIKPGLDFTEEIGRAVGNCDVLIALIGPRWLDAADSTGRRRLDNPQDFVRIEIGSALERKIRVTPVLVQDAGMPSAESLPEPLKPLALHQAIELSDTRWDYDAGRLITALGGKASSMGRWALVAAFAAAVALGGMGWAYFNHQGAAKTKRPVINNSVNPPGKSSVAGVATADVKASADVSGKWLGTWTGPQGKEFRILFSFEVLGDRLMGSVRYPTGEAGIYDGKIDGDRLLFVTRHTPQFESQEATISFVGKIMDNQIEFVMQRPNGAQRVVARRAPAQ